MLDNALLWQITYPNGNRSFLFGTMHVRDNAAFGLIDLATCYLKQCQCYYAEMDLDLAQNNIVMEDYLMPDSLDLRLLIPRIKLERMLRHCSSILNFDLSHWYRFYPLITANKIAETIMLEDKEWPLDQFLYYKAKDMGLELGGVESVERQLEVLKEMPIDLQTKMLSKACKNLSKFRKETIVLKNLYRDQRILKLYKKSQKSLGELRSILLYQRNEQISNFIAEHTSKSSFFAIGAAHLAGYHGVLRKLKSLGLTLCPIYN